MNGLSRLKMVFAELGTVNGLLYLAALAFRRFLPFLSVERYYLVAQPVARERMLPERRGKNVAVMQITAGHPLVAQLTRPPAEIASRFASGAVCFVALRDDQVIGNLWVTQAPYTEPIHRSRFVPFPPERVSWDFDVAILPEERLGFAFARLWDECNDYLRRRGVAWTCSRVSAFNPASIKAHSRLGMKIMSSATYFCAGRAELVVASSSPYLAVSWSARSAPAFVVAPALDP